MSIKVMNDVWWNSKAKGSSLLVQLALADNADEETRQCWPGKSYLSKKTRLSERDVQYCLRDLEELGELTTVYREGHSNLYTITTGGANFAGVGGLSVAGEGGSRLLPEPSIKRQEAEQGRDRKSNGQVKVAALRTTLSGMGIEASYGWAGDALNTFGATEVIRAATEARERIVVARKPTSYLWGILKKGQKDSGPEIGKESGDPIFDSL